MTSGKRRMRLAVYWAASCGGCDISLLEIHEKLLDVIDAIEIVLWPCIVDAKIADVERMPDGHIDVCLFNGGIRTAENKAMALLLRRKSRVLVAHGACAAWGGVPALANLFERGEILDRAFRTTESTVNPQGTVPRPLNAVAGGAIVSLPPLMPCVKALHQVTRVDCKVPGCPPVAKRNVEAFVAALEGKLPTSGAVVCAGDKTVCDECPLERRETRIAAFHRPHEIVPEPGWCLLEQGLVCIGPATRSGCGAECMQANMPCRGCYGPAPGVEDQGAKMIAMLGSLVDSDDAQAIARCVGGIADPVGTFWRFSMATSLMGRARGGGEKG